MTGAMIGLSSFYCKVTSFSPVVHRLMQWYAFQCPGMPFNVCLQVMYWSGPVALVTVLVGILYDTMNNTIPRFTVSPVVIFH